MRRGEAGFEPAAPLINSSGDSAQDATNRRPTSPAIGSVFLYTTLLLADITLVSNAIWTTMVANAFDMKVITTGSLLLRLSHQRNGLSTHPPSKLGTLPS